MKKVLKTSLYIAGALISALIIYYSVPFIKLLMTDEGRGIIRDSIESFGHLAPAIFVCVEIIQIVAAFVPGAPIEIMSGVLFGGFWGIIWCITGIYLGSAIVFLLVRKFGRPLVCRLFSQEKLNSASLLNDEKKLALTIFIIFLIPGTPKDFLTYAAGLTKISPFKFFAIATIARTPSMICSVLMGANIGQGHYTAGIVIFCIIILISVVGYFIRKKYLTDKGFGENNEIDSD